MASDNRFFDYLIQEVTAPENLRNDHKFFKKFPQKHIIKMNTKSVRELTSIAKEKGLRGYYKLKKDDLVALLLEKSAEEMPTPPPRVEGGGKKAYTLRKDNLKPSRNG